MKRFKWEPIALIILVVGLGVYLVSNNRDRFYGIKPDAGATRVELRIGSERGIVEVTQLTLAQAAQSQALPGADLAQLVSDNSLIVQASHRFRVMLRNGFVSEPIDDAAFIKRYGSEVYESAVRSQEQVVFRILNITGWGGLLWAGIGFVGQLAFSGRMLVQWFVSEKRKESVIPEIFWWLSLGGGLLLFAYFVWRQDLIGVLGQSSGIVIYARNIKLIKKSARRRLEQNAPINPT